MYWTVFIQEGNVRNARVTVLYGDPLTLLDHLSFFFCHVSICALCMHFLFSLFSFLRATAHLRLHMRDARSLILVLIAIERRACSCSRPPSLYQGY